MTIQRRYTTRPAKLSRVAARGAAGGLPTITGYAAVFYRAGDPGTEFEIVPGVVERIMPGAFDRAIREDDVRGLFNHDPNLVLGRTSAGTLRLSVDSVGLRYEIDPPDTTTGRDVAELLARGDVKGSSFAFIPTPGGERVTTAGGRSIREVRAVALYDVGPVTFPAYESSTSGVARQGSPNEQARAFLDWLEVEELLMSAGD